MTTSKADANCSRTARTGRSKPAIRVMVEAADEGQAERVAAELANAVRAAMA